MNTDNNLREQLLDISTSFLVQAPAGSGKTSILVQRYLCALSESVNAPEEIIAITFTRKAQGEMKARVLHALQMAANEKAPVEPHLNKLWHLAKKVLQRDAANGWDLLVNPTRLKIQTIDALCSGIVKQMPILSQFGSNPQTIDDASRLYLSAAEQLMQTIDSTITQDYQRGLIVLLRHLDNDRVKLGILLQHMLSKREHWLPTLIAHSGVKDLRTYLERSLILACEEAIADINALRPHVLDVSVMGVNEPQSLNEWLVIVEKLLTSDGSWRKTVGQAQGFHPPSKARNKDEKQRLKEAKDTMLAMLERLQIHDDFRHSLSLLRILPPLQYSNQQWDIIEALLVVLPALAANLTLVFRDIGQVDFTEVALSAMTALGAKEAPSELALELDYKLKHILVDEFQDTSHLQYKLLELLTMTWEPGDGRTLFLVGDPQQSIYSFRQADVGLFIKARDCGIGNIPLEFVQLTTNFRSTASVVDWVNNLFTHSFPKADNKTLGAITYTSSKPNASSNQEPPATCIAVSTDLVASQIIEIVQNTWQKTPNAEIAILVRARNHLDDILPALRLANIPYQGVDIEKLNQCAIVQDILALTKAILHLDDRIAWLAVLRAPWCGLVLKELQIISDYEGTIFQAIEDPQLIEQLSVESKPRIKKLRAIIQDAITIVGRIELAILIKNTANSLSISAYFKDEFDNLAANAFFKFLIEYQYRVEITIPGFLDTELEKLFIEQQKTNEVALQIMTIHKAKGLEFDVVIIPHLDKTTKHDDQELLLLEYRDYVQEYLLLAPIRAANEKLEPIYHYLAWCNKQRHEYERLRELYVAFTRAKQKIYCLADVSERDRVNGMLKHVWQHISHQFQPTALQVKSQQVTKNTNLRRLNITYFTNDKYESLNVSHAPLQTITWHHTWLNQAGTIMHRILCHIARVGVENLTKEYLKLLAQNFEQYLIAAGIDHNYRDKAKQLVMQAIENTLNDEFGKFILSNRHNESYAEWRLTRYIDHECQQLRLDRVFIDKDDTLWLVDYKLVTSSPSIAINQYRAQVLDYAQLLRELRPNNKLVNGLYFPLQSLWHEF